MNSNTYDKDFNNKGNNANVTLPYKNIKLILIR